MGGKARDEALKRRRIPRRRRQALDATTRTSRTLVLVSVFVIHCIHISSSLSSYKSSTRIRRQSQLLSMKLPGARTSPLFHHQQQRQQRPFSGSTARHMVLTTPESIIEQASTQNLLDDLIDESVRTSARRPIMMQIDPSSGWIWQRWKGTVFSETWHSAVAKMAWATIVFFIFKRNPQLTDRLAGFGTLWGQLLR